MNEYLQASYRGIVVLSAICAIMVGFSEKDWRIALASLLFIAGMLVGICYTIDPINKGIDWMTQTEKKTNRKRKGYK